MSDKLQTIRRNRALLKAELESAGAKFKGSAILCPFHEDHKPSAGIYQGKDGAWRFKCQSCGVGGDVFDIRARQTDKPLAEILLEAIGQTKSQRLRQSKRSAQQQSPTGCRLYVEMDSLRAALTSIPISIRPGGNDCLSMPGGC
jgi:DNA primase